MIAKFSMPSSNHKSRPCTLGISLVQKLSSPADRSEVHFHFVVQLSFSVSDMTSIRFKHRDKTGEAGVLLGTVPISYFFAYRKAGHVKSCVDRVCDFNPTWNKVHPALRCRGFFARGFASSIQADQVSTAMPCEENGALPRQRSSRNSFVHTETSDDEGRVEFVLYALMLIEPR